MWASMLHLVFGNVILGVLEGLLLSRMFQCPKGKSILLLIAANYVSAWVGGFLVAGYVHSSVDITVQNVQYWFQAFVLVAFIFTLLLEFPLFWFVLGSRERRLHHALKATVAVNGISYLLLFGWYWMASGTSMMSDLEVVPSHEMEVAEPYVLYFISRDGDRVLRMDLNDPDSVTPISAVAAPHRVDRLFVLPRVGSGFDLLTRLEADARGSVFQARVLADFAEQAPVEWRISEGHSKEVESSWFNFGPVPSIAASSDWEYWTGFWPVEGLGGKNERTGETVRFSLELPFAAWPVRNATQIDGDYVVAQLGEDQICMIHPASSRIALLVRGRGPIVAKPNLSSEEGEAAVDAWPHD